MLQGMVASGPPRSFIVLGENHLRGQYRETCIKRESSCNLAPLRGRLFPTFLHFLQSPRSLPQKPLAMLKSKKCKFAEIGRLRAPYWADYRGVLHHVSRP